MVLKITKFLLFLVFIFIWGINAAFCTPLKIDGLIFDNSDKLMVVNFQKGQKSNDTENVIKKGVLENPDRIYFDIQNAILTTPSKTWELTDSMLQEVTVSQFSLTPDIVRVVIKYQKNKAPKDFLGFEAILNKNCAIIKYSNKFIETPLLTPLYNSDLKEVFAPLKYKIKPKEPTQPVQPVMPYTGDSATLNKMFEQNAEKNSYSNIEKKLLSTSYIYNVVKTQDGVLIKGFGKFNTKPYTYLENPKRLVIDIKDTVLAKNMHNRTMTIGTFEAQNNSPYASREILRIAQFDRTTSRIVIQGESAKDYRLAISPDCQSLYIAKRQDIISSKLTEVLSSVKSYTATKEKDTNVLTIELTEPMALSIFEENNNFYFDMQNVSNSNQLSFDQIKINPYFKDAQLIKIASDKTRLQMPLGANVRPVVLSAWGGKKIKIYFKSNINIEKPKEDIAIKEIKEPIKKQPRPMFLSNYYKVVIDAGHGGTDTGATRMFVDEKNLNLDMAKKVAENLKKEKIKVKLTRDREQTLTLEERVQISEEYNPDIFVSIHHNASVREDIYGIETHWWKDNSLKLAECIHKSMTEEKNLKKWHTINRGLIKSRFYVINHTTAPAVLVEVGFISNPEERKNLLDKKEQEEIAKAISDGIVKYLKSRGKE